MALDKTDIVKVAWLARIAIEDADLPDYLRDVSAILDMVDAMNAVDTQDVEPLAHPLELDARLREDQPTEDDQRERYQAQAPAVRDGYYLVPKVIG